MEFLTKTINSAQLYYAEINASLASMIRETKIYLLNIQRLI